MQIQYGIIENSSKLLKVVNDLIIKIDINYTYRYTYCRWYFCV